MSLNESIVEDGALTAFAELGYAVGHGADFAELRLAKPRTAPCEPTAEPDGSSVVPLVDRLREVIRLLNPVAAVNEFLSVQIAEPKP